MVASKRGVCTDVTRRGAQDASRNQWEENLRHAFSRGARRCAERQATPAMRGDFGAFLIDIWRLEMAVSHSKHTMGALSNRHGYGTLAGPIFGRENGARMRENRSAALRQAQDTFATLRGDILPPFARRVRPPRRKRRRHEQIPRRPKCGLCPFLRQGRRDGSKGKSDGQALLRRAGKIEVMR
jgi:hypothetical protein